MVRQHCWRSKDKLINNECARIDWLAKTYLNQLCVGIGYSLEDLQRAMDERDKWQESQWTLYCYYDDHHLLVWVFWWGGV